MKKITNIMMAVLLSTATITACAGNNTPETWSIAGLYRQEFNIIYNLQQI